MANSPHDDLVILLGSPLSFINKLATADQQRLLAVIHAAHRIQNIEYSAVIDKALLHVPALLRNTVRKIITD